MVHILDNRRALCLSLDVALVDIFLLEFNILLVHAVENRIEIKIIRFRTRVRFTHRLECAADVAGSREDVAHTRNAQFALHFIEQKDIVRARGGDDQSASIKPQRKRKIQAAKFSTEAYQRCPIKRVLRLGIDPLKWHSRELGDNRLDRVLINALLLQDFCDAPSGCLFAESIGREQLFCRRDSTIGKQTFKRRRRRIHVLFGHIQVAHRFGVVHNARRKRHGRRCALCISCDRWCWPLYMCGGARCRRYHRRCDRRNDGRGNWCHRSRCNLRRHLHRDWVRRIRGSCRLERGLPRGRLRGHALNRRIRIGCAELAQNVVDVEASHQCSSVESFHEDHHGPLHAKIGVCGSKGDTILLNKCHLK